MLTDGRFWIGVVVGGALVMFVLPKVGAMKAGKGRQAE